MSQNYGLKVSSRSNNVDTEIDKNLAFTSKFSTLKILKAGNLSVTTDGSGNGTAYYTHSLGFAPAYFASQKRTVQWSYLDSTSYSNAYVPDPGTANQWGSDYHHALHVYTDSTKIYLQAKNAQASTTYTIHYVLLIDKAQDYTGSDMSLVNDYGLKVSHPGIDVTQAKSFEMSYSTRFKSLQYYSENYKYQNLTLPTMWASLVDNPVEEGTYVDINHGLGYAPLFLAFFRSQSINTSYSIAVPYVGVNGQDLFSYGVGAFCDATRVRISFWRKSYLYLGSPSPNYNYDETITVKCYIFTEDLSLSY
jgi:hypothetical protein